MIIKTQLGEDKLKFTVTYLDGKKLPKELASNVKSCVERIGEIDTLVKTLNVVSEQKEDCRQQNCNLMLENETLQKTLEQTRLDSSSTEKRFQEHVADLNLEIAKVEAKYRDVLELSNRQTWGVVVSATVALVSLILYCSTL
jgi:regulator of replication initiation timing